MPTTTAARSEVRGTDSASGPPISAAPIWHTAALVILIVSVAVTGGWLASSAGGPSALVRPPSRLTGVYLPLLVVDWGLVVYVCRVGRPRNVLRDLLGPRAWSVRGTPFDVALGLVCGSAIEGLEAAARPWPNDAVAAILPHSRPEVVAWLFVACTVGFCEEIVYRAYLQTQFAAFTGSIASGVALQAVLFGIAHAEQGVATSARFAGYGAALGVIVLWRGSLVAGITCHVAVDIVGGLCRS